jgi:hypothetical protein
MTISAYINALNTKKSELEGQIQAEMKSPMPDFTKISQLKKLKLAVKTQMAEMLRKHEPATA